MLKYISFIIVLPIILLINLTYAAKVNKVEGDKQSCSIKEQRKKWEAAIEAKFTWKQNRLNLVSLTCPTEHGIVKKGKKEKIVYRSESRPTNTMIDKKYKGIYIPSDKSFAKRLGKAKIDFSRCKVGVEELQKALKKNNKLEDRFMKGFGPLIKFLCDDVPSNDEAGENDGASESDEDGGDSGSGGDDEEQQGDDES